MPGDDGALRGITSKRPKHGGDRKRIDLDEALILNDDRAQQLLALEDALAKLANESPEKAELVKFCDIFYLFVFVIFFTCFILGRNG